jgi:cobalt/nickel transport system ATP-binding protein
MSHHLVETRHLKHIYPDGTMALDNITLRVVHGE